MNIAKGFFSLDEIGEIALGDLLYGKESCPPSKVTLSFVKKGCSVDTCIGFTAVQGCARKIFGAIENRRNKFVEFIHGTFPLVLPALRGFFLIRFQTNDLIKRIGYDGFELNDVRLRQRAVLLPTSEKLSEQVPI